MPYLYHLGADRADSLGGVADPERLHHADPDYYADRAAGLLASARDGTASAQARFARHGRPLTPGGARAVLAAEHGAPGWEQLMARVAALAHADDPFLRAYQAIEARDPGALAGVLDAHPEIIAARGTNGNDLLGMAATAGGLTLARPLLDRGADPGAANVHGWTALHQAAYSDQPDLARALLAAGARPERSARGDGGTPLVVALFWGHRATAELLAACSLAPGNLRVAAGLGDTGAVEALLDPHGGADPGAHRGFYRPHSGFPPWTPGSGRQEAVDEALAWAARNRRTAALGTLARHGARVDADVYRGTALAWAAWAGDAETIRALVGLGADPDARSSFGGPEHGRDVTPLHLAAQCGHGPAIDALLGAGARPDLTDGLYASTPAGWARQFGQTEAEARLRAAGG